LALNCVRGPFEFGQGNRRTTQIGVRDGKVFDVRGDMAAGLLNPCSSEAVRLGLKKMGRETSARQDQARPLGWKDIKEFIQSAGEGLRADRERAMLCVAYETLARRGVSGSGTYVGAGRCASQKIPSGLSVHPKKALIGAPHSFLGDYLTIKIVGRNLSAPTYVPLQGHHSPPGDRNPV